MFRSREEAQGDLGPLHDLLRLIPEQAWDEYHTKQATERGKFRQRVQQDIVHAYMEDQARRLLADVPGVLLSPPAMQAFFFDYLDKWRFRCHKLNDDFTITPNDTALALDFLEQRGETLPLGMGELTNLHLGYRLNSAKSGMATVHIVCPRGQEDIEWQYILLSPDDLEPTPLRRAQPRGPRPRVRPSVVPQTGEAGA